MSTDTGADTNLSVVVVDDHQTFCDLLSLALDGTEDLRCVGTARNGVEARELVQRTHPDLALVDIFLHDEDGIELARGLRETHPQLRVVLLSADADRTSMQRAAEIGASGLMPKSGSLEELLGALRSATVDSFIVAPRLLHTLVAPQPARDPVPTLTTRERQVLQLMTEGFDPSQVARQLDISVNTSRGHVKSILHKLDAHSQLEAVSKALRLGITTVTAS